MAKNPETILKRPLSGLWNIPGLEGEHPGSLTLEGDFLTLSIFIRGPHDKAENHPFIRALASRPTIIGYTQGGGLVSLLRCVRSGVTSSPYSRTERQIQLEIICHEAWLGHVQSSDEIVRTLNCGVPGLHSALENTTVRELHLGWPSDDFPEVRSAIKAATDADVAFLVSQTPPINALVEHKGQPFKISFYTSFASSHSVTGGEEFASANRLQIECEGASIADLLDVKTEIERFLSLFCLGPVLVEGITVARDNQDLPGSRLLWMLGELPLAKPTERMPHQLPVWLAQHPSAAEQALVSWFGASEERRRARYLACKVLERRDASIAGFLEIAQAWEIFGREVKASDAIDKAVFAAACSEAEAILTTRLGDTQGQRLANALRALNQPSFAKLVEGALKYAPPAAVHSICSDTNEFVSDVVAARNALTHMKDQKRLSVHEASRMSGRLTAKLVTLFCLMEIRAMGLPFKDLSLFLRNNETARWATIE
jgi:hypothetical protein